MSFAQDFIKFLEEYKIIGLAIAFVIGVTVKDLVDAVVEALIMPIVAVFLPEGSWQEATLTLFSVDFQIGLLLSAFIDFLIIALLVFLFVRYALRKEEIGKV
jgi:large conductance mechanosensitive channel